MYRTLLVLNWVVLQRLFAGLALLSLMLLISIKTASAGLIVEITQGREDAIKIAIVPFAWQDRGRAPEDLADIVAADLYRSGQFKPMAVANMLSRPTEKAQVHYRDWQALAADYLVIGRWQKDPASGAYKVAFDLFDVYQQRLLRYGSASSREPRRLAHFISDQVFQQIVGVKGAFSTRLAYVTKTRTSKGHARYQLHRSDVDGYLDKVIVKSSQPILSPAWHPNGRQLAYVSYKSGKPAIYMVDIITGKEQKLVDYPGMSSAPAFSPDGQQLAFVLSKDGNPEIYQMNLLTRKIRRLTKHFAIDTEPTWAPDGKHLYFTSDRGGRPQIYQLNLANLNVKRITYQGQENANSSITSDGRSLVMVHRLKGQYHIAVQDLKRGTVKILTQSNMDESPSISPNGAMVIYATQSNNKGLLAAVSVDGNVKVQLPSSQGDVREPAWSPYLDKK